MSGRDRSTKDKEMAARLKKEGKTPPRKWHGVGANVSAAADKMGVSWKGRYSSTYERGMLGGALADMSKGIDVLTDVREIPESKQDYSHYRIVVNGDTNKDLLDLFIKSFDKLKGRDKDSAPSVVTQ